MKLPAIVFLMTCVTVGILLALWVHTARAAETIALEPAPATAENVLTENGIIWTSPDSDIALPVQKPKKAICQVSTGFTEEFPGWASCPFDGQFSAGYNQYTNAIICATPQVVCQ